MSVPVQEGVKLATSVVDGLKQQPLSLALIAMNVVFVLFVTWLAYTINNRTENQYRIKDDLITKLIDKCGRSPSEKQ